MISLGLQDWLDVATRDLCAEARVRVCEEVKAHYAAAYDALITSGESADVAAAGALASLGNAKKARRRYRRTYITKREQKYLDSLTDTKTAWLAFLNVIPVGSTVLFQSFYFGSTAVIVHGMALLALFVGTISVLVWIRTRFSSDPKQLSRLLAIGMTSFLITIVMFGTFFMHVASQPPMNGAILTESGLAAIGSVVALLVGLVLYFRGKMWRLHRKLVTSDEQTPSGVDREE